MNTEHVNFVALCPFCQAPFHYTQVKFKGGENDYGGWKVKCDNCCKDFNLQALNPNESFTNLPRQIIEEYLDWPPDNDIPRATASVRHNVERRKVKWEYNLHAPSLYVCRDCLKPLDIMSYDALGRKKDSLQSAWLRAENYLLASNGPSSDRIFVSIEFDCDCTKKHSAIFSANTNLGASAVPIYDRCMLVHVSGADLEDRLNCLASKSDVMDLLEKLIIRWHCIFDRILLATPFIGHQWMKSNEVQEIWEWLFKNLDPDKVTLLSRKSTWTSFKKIQNESGIGFEELERYDLEDKIVSSGATKQDFHAKFFAGISSERVEVLSGSANLLRGPSIENISFRCMRKQSFDAKYLAVIKSNLELPLKRRTSSDVLLYKEGKWLHTFYSDSPWYD